jgi:hypothetical protein
MMAFAHSNPCDRAAKNARYTQNANRDKQNGDRRCGIQVPMSIVFD